MRIAIIGSRGLRSSYGGIEKVLAEICPRLAAMGFEIDIYGEAGSSESLCRVAGIRHISVPAIPGKYTETISRTLFSIVLSWTRRYDVVNFVALGPGSLAFLTRCFGRRTVVSIHGLDWQRTKWPGFARGALRLAERAIVCSADRITVVSEQLKAYFRTKYHVEVECIPNGAQLRQSDSIDTQSVAPELKFDSRYVLFASRLVKEKGAHELIAAFQSVKTEAYLVIAGGGRYDREYMDSLRSIDETGRVVFVGHREGGDLDALFMNAYVYCLPSHIEGLSLSLLEAIGFGKAVLVSDIPENIEVIGDAGVSFSVGEVGDLANKLQLLLSDDIEVTRLAARARARAETLFSWEAVARRYADMYVALARR